MLLRRQGDRWRNADSSTEALVSSDDPRRIKGVAPAIQGAPSDCAYTGHGRIVTALLDEQVHPRAGVGLLLVNVMNEGGAAQV